MKPIDVGDNSFAKYNEESNVKDPKFKVGFQNLKMYLVKDMHLIGVNKFL